MTEPQERHEATPKAPCEEPEHDRDDARISQANCDDRAPSEQRRQQWTDALTRELGDRNVANWFGDSARVAFSDGRVRVCVASEFLRNWMQKNFRAGVVKAASSLFGTGVSVEFDVDPTLIRSPAGSEEGAASGAPRAVEVPAKRRTEPAQVFAARRSDSPELLSHVIRSTVANGTPRAVRSNASSVQANGRRNRSAQQTASNEQQTKKDPTPVTQATSRTSATAAPGSDDESSAPVASLGSPARAAGADGAQRLSRRLLELTDFVEGPGNVLALTASRQVSEAPGARINPLLLHGNVGTGKTHLLEGIYRRLRRSFPHLQVLLLSAETFSNQFSDALRQRSLPSFRQRFRTVDAFLVDDVDFFDGKPVFQEEFLHTIKQLEVQGRQIALTSDRHPRLLTRTSEELASRLFSGLVCRIENPDLETRRQIVRQKAERMECDIADEALQFVAQRFSGNVRELEGALQSLAVWHSMSQRRVSLSVARDVLADLERDCIRIVRMGDVENTVCRFFGISSEDLRSANRARQLSQPRMLAMFLARKLTQSAYNEIGRHFGGRNHSTVMSAQRKVEEWLAEGTPIKIAAQTWRPSDLIETLEQQVKAC